VRGVEVFWLLDFFRWRIFLCPAFTSSSEIGFYPGEKERDIVSSYSSATASGFHGIPCSAGK
jgi:hypothetical protein